MIASAGGQFGQHRVGQHLAGALPALGAEVVVDEVEGVVADDGGEDLESLGDHLGADAVAGDDGDDGLAGCLLRSPARGYSAPDQLGQVRLTAAAATVACAACP